MQSLHYPFRFKSCEWKYTNWEFAMYSALMEWKKREKDRKYQFICPVCTHNDHLNMKKFGSDLGCNNCILDPTSVCKSIYDDWRHTFNPESMINALINVLNHMALNRRKRDERL